MIYWYTDSMTSVSDLESHYMYIIECSDGTFYTGYTTDLDRRVSEHNKGDGAKYTQGRTPVELLYSEEFDTQSAAMSREYEVKQFSRGEKESLVDSDSDTDSSRQ